MSRMSIPSDNTIFTRPWPDRSEEHTSELQSRLQLVCRLLLENKNALAAVRVVPDPTVQQLQMQNLVITAARRVGLLRVVVAREDRPAPVQRVLFYPHLEQQRHIHSFPTRRSAD